MKKLFSLLAVIALIAISSNNLFSQTYLTEDFESAWSGSPAAPPGWTQSRVVLIGTGTPVGVNINGEKDWKQNIFSGGIWSTASTYNTGGPASAQSGTGVLFMEEGKGLGIVDKEKKSYYDLHFQKINNYYFAISTLTL